MRIVTLLFALLLAASVLFAQGIEEKDIPLRGDILEDKRREKIKNPEKIEAAGLEKALLFVEQNKVMEYLRAGYHNFHLKLGGLSTGSGFALGSLYRNRIFSDAAVFTGSATWSLKGYQQYDLGLETRLTGSASLRAGVDSRYRNFSEEDFFGIGLNSSVEDETNYRLEETRIRLNLVFKPVTGLNTGLYSGYRKTRTGKGGSAEVPSLQVIFNRADAPAFSETIDHWLAGFAIGLDLRDSPGNPRSGIALLFNRGSFMERDEDNYGFQRTELEFQGYLPFYHKHRVFALRLSAVDTEARKGESIPFYDHPAIGGHNSLRGFRERRFQDRKVILANLEYRFEAFIGLDIALFGDLGQVGREWDDFQLRRMESSYGGGLRFNTAQSVFLRIDIGHGREGTRFFFKFGNVY